MFISSSINILKSSVVSSLISSEKSKSQLIQDNNLD